MVDAVFLHECLNASESFPIVVTFGGHSSARRPPARLDQIVTPDHLSEFVELLLDLRHATQLHVKLFVDIVEPLFDNAEQRIVLRQPLWTFRPFPSGRSSLTPLAD